MDIDKFLLDHVYQITATIGLVTYSLVRNKLTPGGILAGIFVAFVHMLHPWPAFFWLLIVFFSLGTVVTKIGHEAKSHLTQSSTGSSGGEGARTSAQVFANSGFACILILLHVYLLNSTPFISSKLSISPGIYLPTLQRLLPIGIVAQYAAVASDTFSSELGILAKGMPILITQPWKQVPRGTNGGVTIEGLIYGAVGSFLLTVVAMLMFYVSPPYLAMLPSTAALLTNMGLIGSIIDSVLGALVQVTVTDKGSGKVIEGSGGQRVKTGKGGSRVQIGSDLLTNNGVNFAMASLTGLLAMGAAWMLGLELGLK